MIENAGSTAPVNTVLNTWLQMSTEFWGKMAQSWISNLEENSHGKPNRLQETFLTNLKAMQSLNSLLSDPATVDNISRGMQSFPEIYTKIMTPAWKGLFHLIEEFSTKAARIGQSTTAYTFENLDQEAFQAFSEIYEKEFRQFLQIPPVGLTRVYQEHMNAATDRFNQFQATVAEFISLLYLPVEKSLKVMQEELSVLAEEGKLPDSSKDYYRMWVKTLEGHYMTLFKSPEYNAALTKTLNSLSDFINARQEMLYDYLQLLPVPTHKDMDDLYKEIYLLKKRIKDLENRERHLISVVPDSGK